VAKKVALALVVIFLVFYIVSQPAAAADLVQTILGGIGWVFTGIVTFFQNLV
jgi:Na+/H+ antiporter NhaD/arsenite permease-like protein